MKKKIAILITSFVLVCLLTLFVTSLSIRPELNYFLFTLEVDDSTIEVGESIDVIAKVKNKSIGLYPATMTPDQIMITVTLAGEEEPAFYLLGKDYLLFPFQTVTERQTILFTQAGTYTIEAVTMIAIGDVHFNLVETEQIIVTGTIE